MLNKRLGGAVIVKNGIAVQSIGFNKYLPIGKPEIVVEFLNKWGIDEITILDISASSKKKSFDIELLKRCSKFSFVPIAVGGGIKSINDIDELIKNGADKVCLNNSLFVNLDLLKRAAEKYGNQCIVAVVDFVKIEGQYFVYDYRKKSSTGIKVSDWVKILEDNNAGEILLQSIDRDGMYNGFDINMYKDVSAISNIPIIALGGAGSPNHFVELFDNTNISAAYAGNYLNFTEHSVITIKSVLLRNRIKIRLETNANYNDFNITDNNRIDKKSDDILEKLLYTKIEKEVI
jgi:imidazole glycerol-phosphate synthase subunit HisF